MRIALGADHAGVALKDDLKRLLDARGIAYTDFGTHSTESVDYPDFAATVAHEVASGAYDRGILVCGSGIGMAIAANKVAGIRAALGHRRSRSRASQPRAQRRQRAVARRAPHRRPEEARRIVDIFLDTPFAGGRHQRRIDKIAALEQPLHRCAHLAADDPEIAAAISHELRRQEEGLELIASENFVSPAVLEAAGSVLTNKYAEGYPGKRYYGGCEFVDVVETLAIDRAKQLFGAEHANVQPHSGAQANMAVYFAVLKPGDTILGMNLAHGGHLTHGHPLELLRQVLQHRAVRRAQGRRAHRLRRARPRWRASTSRR